MSYDQPTHSYVECCDAPRLTDRTVRVYLQGAWVRVCREGMGCTTCDTEATA